MQNTSLVILAAGMGSRFGGGGAKQVAHVDTDGCYILDYSIYDALAAGITDVVLVIKREMEADFRETVGKRAGKRISLRYAYQDLNDIPPGCSVGGRVKPWGTGHALYAARNAVKNPFITIFADDFYGRNAFDEMAIAAKKLNEGECFIAGYTLSETLSESGGVSRAVCRAGADGKLTSIEEHLKIKRDGGAVTGKLDGRLVELPPDSQVSLGMCGFHQSVFAEMGKCFDAFMRNLTPENHDTEEFFLPAFMNERIADGTLDCRIVPVNSKWHGITYQEDKEALVAALAAYRKQGIYPERLWG